jgi:ABC-type polysaccharide/polyol phosphate transport system ATPase subunit
MDRLTLTENTFVVGSLFGLSQKEVKERFDSIVEFAGLQNFVNTKIYQFSSGMKERLAFSIAIYCSPEILLLDEVFAVGDEDFRNKSARKIKELVRNGASAILVSHELWMIEKYCDRVIWLDEGKVVKEGKIKDIIDEYKKVYSEKNQ